VSVVREYYDENAQKEWERLERHPYEFILTTYMMDKYIRPGDSILDIGGGPGRYALFYAQQGCQVTLADLSEGNIRLAQAKAEERGLKLEAFACDCLYLEELKLGLYDHVFLMGPLYHLLEQEQRVRAVEIALRHVNPGGILYVSFILDFAAVIYDLKSGPNILPAELAHPVYQRLYKAIRTGQGYAGPAFTDAYFIHQTQIKPFMTRFGLQQLHLFGQEGILAPNELQLLTYPEQEQELWLELAKQYLEIPEFLAYSEHAMYIGRKSDQPSESGCGDA